MCAAPLTTCAESRQGLQEIQSISGVSERQAQVKFLTEKVTRAKNVHHSMKVELQDVDQRDQKKYERKVNEFERRLKKAQTELRAAKNSAVSPLCFRPCVHYQAR